ncbi:hypothetical protein [Rhizobium binxianense]
MFQAAVLLYGLVAAAAMAATVLEGWIHHDGWGARRLAGLAVCLLWPLLLVLFLLHGSVLRVMARYS